jgi:hypothetical protein
MIKKILSVIKWVIGSFLGIFAIWAMLGYRKKEDKTREEIKDDIEKMDASDVVSTYTSADTQSAIDRIKQDAIRKARDFSTNNTANGANNK